MSEGRHSYVRFFPSDWIGGTARMTPMQELVYFRICCWIWDKAEPVPASELPLMLGGIDGWREIVADLIAAGKLDGSPDGSADGGVGNSRALIEANQALNVWRAKSQGGKRGACKTNAKPVSGGGTPDASPDSTPGGTHDGMGPALPTQNQNQIERDTDVSLSSAPEKASKSSLADLAISDEWRLWARQHHVSVDLDAELEKFRDWHRSKGRRLKDWPAGFRNWLRKAQEMADERALEVPTFLKRSSHGERTDAELEAFAHALRS